MQTDRWNCINRQEKQRDKHTEGSVLRVKDSDLFGTFLRKKIGLFVIIFKVIKLNHKGTPLNKQEENQQKLVEIWPPINITRFKLALALSNLNLEIKMQRRKNKNTGGYRR